MAVGQLLCLIGIIDWYVLVSILPETIFLAIDGLAFESGIMSVDYRE